MTPDDHQRERITTWRLAYNGECAQDPEDRARAAECALAEFDKRFPAPDWEAMARRACSAYRTHYAEHDADTTLHEAMCAALKAALGWENSDG